MAFDFYGIALLGKVTAPDGKVYELFPTKGSADLLPKMTGNKGVAPFLEEMTVEIGLGMNSRVTMKLAPTFVEGCELIDSGMVEKDSILSVRFGYADKGHFSPWLSVVQLQPSASFGVDMDITLQGMGFGWVMQKFAGDKSWANKSSRQIIQEIAKNYGLKLQITGTDALEEVRGSSPQQGYSDWQFMRILALNAGCEMWMDSDTVYVQSLKELSSQVPTKKLINMLAATRADYRSVLNGVSQDAIGNGVYPMSSFQIETSSVWLPGWSRLVKGGDIDADSKQSHQVTIDKPTTQLLGKKTPSPPKDAQAVPGLPKQDIQPDAATGAGKISLVSSRDKMSEPANQAELDRGQMFNLVANASTIGIPNIKPGEIVQVLTGAHRFDGNYMIKSVTHTIGKNGYDCSFELFRSGYPEFVQLLAAQGGTNTTQASVSDPGKTTVSPSS